MYEINLEKIKSQISVTESLELIDKVDINVNNIMIHTNEITCKDDRTNLFHKLGKFEIKIPYECYNECRIAEFIRINVKGKRTRAFSNRNMNAPHIFENGKVCWGNARASVKTACLDSELYLLSLSIIEFLRTANIDDTAGGYIDSWKIDFKGKVDKKILKNDIRRLKNKKILNENVIKYMIKGHKIYFTKYNVNYCSWISRQGNIKILDGNLNIHTKKFRFFRQNYIDDTDVCFYLSK